MTKGQISNKQQGPHCVLRPAIGGESMVNWEYTFYVSNVSEAGIKEIPSATNVWDDNGYRRHAGGANQRETRQKVNIVNQYGQKGWELISITPISFVINGKEIGQTEELLFAFKRPIEQTADSQERTHDGGKADHSGILQPTV